MGVVVDVVIIVVVVVVVVVVVGPGREPQSTSLLFSSELCFHE